MTIQATATEITADELQDGDQIVRPTGRISAPIRNLRRSVGTFGNEAISFEFGDVPEGTIPAIGVRLAQDIVTVVRVAKV